MLKLTYILDIFSSWGLILFSFISRASSILHEMLYSHKRLKKLDQYFFFNMAGNLYKRCSFCIILFTFILFRQFDRDALFGSRLESVAFQCRLAQLPFSIR